MPVYVVVIGDWQTSVKQVGAVYLNEDKAKAEVERLNSANMYVRSHYVVRHTKEIT